MLSSGDCARVSLTSRPKSATVTIEGRTPKRQWNAPPPELFPKQQTQYGGASARKPSAMRPATSTAVDASASGIAENSTTQRRVATRPGQRKSLVPQNRAVRTQRESLSLTGASRSAMVAQASASLKHKESSYNQPQTKRGSHLTGLQVNAIARGCTKRLSQVTWARLQKVTEETEAAAKQGDQSVGASANAKYSVLIRASELEASDAQREERQRSYLLKSSMNKQDVYPEDVRPLIDIAYSSPFIEVRRDAAAALASLSRNAANLEILSDIGTLGALMSMINASKDRNDSSIARYCAQTLASMAKLPSVKTNLLQTPDGIDCAFSLLHSNDIKLRRTAFELMNNLVTTEELRQVVAKREGFSFMLMSCASKDLRIRCLAAAILNQLVISRDNRFLFYHSTHFQTLADILHDPFMEKDFSFRRDLLSFIHQLVSEEENGRKFVELNLIPTLLLLLDSPKTNLQISLFVVSILEALASNRKNHVALIEAKVLDRIVQLCFSPTRGLSKDKNASTSSSRPRTAPPRPKSVDYRAFGAASFISPAKTSTVTSHSDFHALLRPAFVIFCEMAKNPLNREHVIRSKLVDYIASKDLYASSDKRVRRAVITLLTFLICKERERDRDRRATSEANSPTDDHEQESFDTDYKHYIELLARGVVKCLFGILHGNDFSMKIDAIGAISQLTDDESSRLTMCKPQLLQALKEFAFHPLVQTRYHIAKIIANFSQRSENILKLVDEGMLSILVKYVCPISRNNEVLVEATRAIAAMSMVHVTRSKLVESGVLGMLIQFCKASNTNTDVHLYALTAIRNLRHDAAALRIQAIYRGWCVRASHARSISTRKRRVQKMSSLRKLDNSLVSVIERFATS